jgi:hypothetical protein
MPATSRQVVVFVVRQSCEFAGRVLPAGATVVVRPSHPSRPLTMQVDLPAEYGDLAELEHGGLLARHDEVPR